MLPAARLNLAPICRNLKLHRASGSARSLAHSTAARGALSRLLRARGYALDCVKPARYGHRVSNQTPAKDQASLLRRYLPGVRALRGYQRTWLRGDLLAGVTVAAYLVPQVMAYAEVAGLPAITGLWAAVGPLVAYAILGSSRQLSVGPESSTALMTAAAVTALVAGDQQTYANTAAG